MAWKVIDAHMNSLETSKAVSPYYQQILEITITGTAADVALDLGDPSGTFWTAALADTTYGAVAAKVLAALQAFDSAAAVALMPQGNFMLYRVRVAPGSETGTGDYSISSWTNRIPNFAFHATTGGPGGTNVILSWEMKPGYIPVQGDITL